VSQSEAPDAVAFAELETLVRALGEELSRFRRRALAAEAQVKALEQAGPMNLAPVDAERMAVLEAENRHLRDRLETATARTAQMLERLRFLRQQTEAGEPA
jgi:hypothetical protein